MNWACSVFSCELPRASGMPVTDDQLRKGVADLRR